jgi:MoaA/NifB/PqqE/SkfB family radical SAM enzyme
VWTRDQPEAGVGGVTQAADGWRPDERGRDRGCVGMHGRRTGLTHALEVDREATRILYESRVVVLVVLDKVAYLAPELGVFRLEAIELIGEGSEETISV